MNILGIDCSASIMSISLKSGERLFESAVHDGFHHSENLLPQIDSLLTMATIAPGDIDLICVSSGPGSFTGLRIAMSTAKGIAMGASADLVSVPTLDSYALGQSEFDGAVIPIIDARKQRFYAAVFERGIKKSKDLDITPVDLIENLSQYERILITGPDARKFRNFSENDARIIIDGDFTTVAGTRVIDLGLKRWKEKGPDKHGSGPVYIRKSEAEISMFGE